MPWARQMATRFARPVYLVGSSLELPDPRDVDVRVEVTDKEFHARWGDPRVWKDSLWISRHDGSMRYAADMWDLSREASLNLQLNIDFQVQPLCESICHHGKHMLRLDDLEVVFLFCNRKRSDLR